MSPCRRSMGAWERRTPNMVRHFFSMHSAIAGWIEVEAVACRAAQVAESWEFQTAEPLVARRQEPVLYRRLAEHRMDAARRACRGAWLREAWAVPASCRDAW